MLHLIFVYLQMCHACNRRTAGPYFCGECGARQPEHRLGNAAIYQRRSLFDARLRDVKVHATKTSLAHGKVKREFLQYMVSDGAAASLLAATPLDVIRFLMSKDSGGTTRVHLRECPFWQYGGSLAGQLCDCPKRAAATALNTIYGYLRAVFNKAGLTAVWNPIMCSGNPTTAPHVEAYLELIGREQLASGVVKRRAPLLGVCVFRYIIDGYLRRITSFVQNRKFVKILLVLRDALFLSVLWHTGLRAGDALRLLHQQVELSHDEDGQAAWCLSVAVTKSARDARQRRKLTLSDDGTFYSPIALMRAYKRAASKLGIRVHVDSMFRNVRLVRGGHYQLHSTATWAVMSRRFREMLSFLQLPSAITLHSPHGSLPRMWRDNGVDTAIICRSIDWTTSTFQYYTDTSREVLLLPVALAMGAPAGAV
jgi:hypothetical protein